ncbi:MAG: SPFH domain-containing protein [Chitinispirillales bacterium]|jgi:membrane protease subunit (stomatin/prohibitin family)|nr:SPFH domain-containing protein [Chitinispirillales bacterium]
MNKGIIQVIKYEGSGDDLVWKSPIEDFNIGSQLVVHQSQEAIFFKNGQALDLFGPGRHTLTTMNIPLIGRLVNLVAGGQSPFHCQVYFINKVEQMAVKWGTDSKVEYMEPAYKFPLKIGASGEMSVRVEDAKKLIVKIVGKEAAFNREALSAAFRAFLMAHVKPHLSKTMQEGGFGIFEADSRLGDLSAALREMLAPDFAGYGLALERFFVTAIAKPDGDAAYEKFKELHIRQYADVADAQIRQKVGIIDQETDAQKLIIESAALAQKRVQEGYTYHQERGFDVAEKAAQNEGSGNFSSAGIGLGMMSGIAGGMGGMVAGVAANAMAPLTQSMDSPPVNAAHSGDMAAFKQKVEKLKMMMDAGMLSAEEFANEKRSLLNNL